MMVPEPGATVRRLPFLSVPAWDISDEEIAEWKAGGRRFSAYTAERIRDGAYDNGQELYPYPGSVVYREITRGMVDQDMKVLAERGMVRQAGGKWYAIAPGKMVPSIRRAVGVLLGVRGDLPSALAAELDSWKLTLDAIEAGQAAGGTISVPGSTRAVAAG
jgi:hypothetical protein